MTGQKRLAGAFMIRLDRIEADPDQPRKKFDSQHIVELTASIKRLGVLQPISLRYIPSIDRYRIIAGECRFTASKQAGLTEIPAWVRTPEENQILMEQVIENWQRSDLSPFEIADSLGILRDANGYTQVQLAEFTGKSKGEISKILSLLEIDPEVQQLARQDSSAMISRRHLYALREFPVARQLKLLSGIQDGRYTAESLELLAATQLLLSQRAPRPASDLRYAFQAGHPVQKLLIRNCTDKLIAFEFSQIANGKTKRGQYAPAARLIEGVCGSPAFRARCGNTFPLEAFLGGGGILMLEGGEDGVAPEVTQTIMSSIVMKVINYVRKRPTPFPRVLLVLDEATNANLVSNHEAAALAECQKMGLDIHILVQMLDFPTADICNAVLSNSVRHEWYYNANPNVIRKAVDDLGLRGSDYDQGNELRSLKVGERWVKYRGKTKERVWREQGQMLQNPWALPRLATKKGFKALAEIRRRAEFQTPAFGAENELGETDQPKIESPGSAAENLRRRIEEQRNEGHLFNKRIVKQSRKKTGFDYYLAEQGSLLFQESTGYEISGILRNDDSEIRRRVRQKVDQVKRGDSELDAHVFVMEFSQPKARTDHHARPRSGRT